MEDKLIWIWFAECFHYGSIKPLQILSEVSAEDFYDNRQHCAEQHDFLTKQDYQRIMAGEKEDYLNIINVCREKRMEIITWNDPSYPQRLRQIDNPPMVLYYWGDLSCLSAKLCISVVGTRDCTMYSRKIAIELSKDLANRGVTIISGCALGVDSAAHRGALEAEHPTAAILGTPLDVDYPAPNSGLKRNILNRGGVIMSEYPPGTKVHKQLFPIRNRLLSGLSDGTVIVEAARNSGSLHTAESAMEQGRELFCVPPSDIFQSRYDGVKEYLRNGAHIVFSSQDVLDVFRFVYTPPEYTQITFASPAVTASAPVPEVDGDQAVVIQALTVHRLTVNGLAEQTKIPAYRLIPLLTQMELSGLIRKTGSVYENR